MINNNLLMKYLLLLFFACAVCSCTRTFVKNKKHQIIKNYIESAGHLSETQKTAMIKEKPFISMTCEEAGIAMRLQNSQVILDSNILYTEYIWIPTITDIMFIFPAIFLSCHSGVFLSSKMQNLQISKSFILIPFFPFCPIFN